MGATNFGQTRMIKGDARDAYSELCSEALEYSGHQDGYNGTISTTSGLRNLTSKAPRYGTKAFYEWEDKVLSEDMYGIEKWGDCGYVEISKNTKLFKEAKANSWFKGKKGVRYFYFFGWAAE